MTLQDFDSTIANRDLDTAYMSYEFREGIRQTFMERDSFKLLAERMEAELIQLKQPREK